MERRFEEEVATASERQEELTEQGSSSAREAQQAAGNAAVARELDEGDGRSGSDLVLGTPVKSWFSTGGMLGGLAGGANLKDVHRFSAPHAGRFLATFRSDFGFNFGAKVVVRDAQTKQPIASFSGEKDSFSVSFSAEESAQLEIVVTPLSRRAWMHNRESRSSSDSWKWFSLGDRQAGGGYSLVVTSSRG